MTRTSDHDLGVRTDRRIGEVDAIRRIALFGILITNVVVAVSGIRSIQGWSAARPSPQVPTVAGGLRGRDAPAGGGGLRSAPAADAV